MPAASCPECQAPWSAGSTCQDHFYQMLYWENEFPGHGRVHHLMVTSYYLQHPSLLSPEGLDAMRLLLTDFVKGADPQELRRRNRDLVDSGKRQWKVTATPEAHGAYAHPVSWTMRAGDVVAAGPDHYLESVQTWATTIAKTLNEKHAQD